MPKVLTSPQSTAAHQHGTDDARQKNKVVHAIQLQRLLDIAIYGCRNALFAVMVRVKYKVNHQQQ